MNKAFVSAVTGLSRRQEDTLDCSARGCWHVRSGASLLLTRPAGMMIQLQDPVLMLRLPPFLFRGVHDRQKCPRGHRTWLPIPSAQLIEITSQGHYELDVPPKDGSSWAGRSKQGHNG